MEVKTIWWYKVQGGGHERMERKCIAMDETQVNSLSDFSWTYRRHWHDGLVALTPNVDGVMDQWWYDQWKEQPNPTWMRSESVMFKSDLLPIKFLQVIFPIFPQSLLTNTSLFFIKLEEDNICLFYNSTLWVNPSLCDVLTILVKVKLRLVMMDNFVAIWCFNEFNDKDNAVLCMFRKFEKGRKENSTSSLS